MKSTKINPELSVMFSGICAALEMDEKEVNSKCRDTDLKHARFLYFKHAKDTYKNKYSLAEIGSIVGKDHATVRHGVIVINRDIKDNHKGLKEKYERTLCVADSSGGRSAAQIARKRVKIMQEKVKNDLLFIQKVKENTTIEFTKPIDSNILHNAVQYFKGIDINNSESIFKLGNIEIIITVINKSLVHLEVWNGEKDFFNLAPEQLTYFTTQLNLENGTK